VPVSWQVLGKGSGYGHGEAVESDIGTGAIGTELTEEEPALEFKGNMCPDTLDIGQCCNDTVSYLESMLTSSASLVKVLVWIYSSMLAEECSPRAF